MIESDPHKNPSESDPKKADLPKPHKASKAESLSEVLARKIIDEVVPKASVLWDTNLCLVTKLVDGNYKLLLTGDLNRDTESLAFDLVKAEMVQRDLIVTIDYVEYTEGSYLQRCSTGVAPNVDIR